MQLFETVERDGHEEVVFFHYEPAGLKAIVAIHAIGIMVRSWAKAAAGLRRRRSGITRANPSITGLLEHPRTNRNNQVRFFCDPDEFIRWHHTVLRVMPAN